MRSTDVKEIYDADYFLNSVDGFNEFSEFDGTFGSLFIRFKRNIRMMGLDRSHRLLEIGCGRGEVCIYHAINGGKAKGIDYSADAISLARTKAISLNAQVEFLESSFDALSDDAESYDRIYASEFIEHISKDEGRLFLALAYSKLSPGGKLYIYTMPNTLQRRYGYPIIRLFSALGGRCLPRQQPDTLSEHYRLYHLNEQNYFSLKRLAAGAGFRKVEIGYDHPEKKSSSLLGRVVRKIIAKSFFRHILLSNLYLLAEK